MGAAVTFVPGHAGGTQIRAGVMVAGNPSSDGSGVNVGVTTGITQDVVALDFQNDQKDPLAKGTRISLGLDGDLAATAGSENLRGMARTGVALGIAHTEADRSSFLAAGWRFRTDVLAGVDLAHEASPYVGGRVTLSGVLIDKDRPNRDAGLGFYAQVDTTVGGPAQGATAGSVGIAVNL